VNGLYVVFKKELRDHFTSYRFVILFALIAMVSFITSYMVAIDLRENLEELATVRFPFLMLFNATGTLFSTVQFVAFFGPLIGLVLGFDAINRERSHRTLIKLVAQPIYRDAVVNGKFLAGVVTITIMLAAITLVIAGFGLAILGVVPGAEDLLRLTVFFIISVCYLSFWLGLAILFSLLFKNIATSALASVAVWIFLSFFVGLAAEAVAGAAFPVDSRKETELETIIKHTELKRALTLCSPMALYDEATSAIINPMSRSKKLFLSGPLEQILSSRFQNPLAVGQSLLVVFPYVTILIGMTLVCFAVSYVVFIVQEIRV
jgi:ABC-2 type transport system permease protein